MNTMTIKIIAISLHLILNLSKMDLVRLCTSTHADAPRDRSGNPVFGEFRDRKFFVSDTEFWEKGVSGSIPSLISPLFLVRHRPGHAFPNLRFDKRLHLSWGLGRPVGLAGVYITQTGRDIRIASRKSLD